MSRDPFAHPHAGALLRHIRALGFHVSVFELSRSMLNGVPPSVEIHAVGLDETTPSVHVVKVVQSAESDDTESMLYRAACGLAESVGIELMESEQETASELSFTTISVLVQSSPATDTGESK